MRFPIKKKDGSILFIDSTRIYYIKADGNDVLVRTLAKRMLRSVDRLAAAEARLERMGDSFRAHRSFVVNLDHVRALWRRRRSDFAIQLDPPVNQ